MEDRWEAVGGPALARRRRERRPRLTAPRRRRERAVRRHPRGMQPAARNRRNTGRSTRSTRSTRSASPSAPGGGAGRHTTAPGSSHGAARRNPSPSPSRHDRSRRPPSPAPCAAGRKRSRRTPRTRAARRRAAGAAGPGCAERRPSRPPVPGNCDSARWTANLGQLSRNCSPGGEAGWDGRFAGLVLVRVQTAGKRRRAAVASVTRRGATPLQAAETSTASARAASSATLA